MQTTFDIEKINWITVPGQPTLGSFLAKLAHAPVKDGNATIGSASFPRPASGYILVKYEVPTFTAGDLGFIPGNLKPIFMLTEFPMQMKNGAYPHGAYGPERILAYSVDAGNIIAGAINALNNPPPPASTAAHPTPIVASTAPAHKSGS